MEVNQDTLTPALGDMVDRNTPVGLFPDRVTAFYSEISIDDLREGMEDVYFNQVSISKSDKNNNRTQLTELGTLLGRNIVFTPENHYVDINHYVPLDYNKSPKPRQYVTMMESDSWSIRGKFYQKHTWNYLPPGSVEMMQLRDLDKNTIRLDSHHPGTHTTTIMSEVSEQDWENIKTQIKNYPETRGVYWLFPKPIVVKRASEAIPPMPGQKPAPGEPQPSGEPIPGEGEAQPSDIPPMPGQGSSQQTDKTRTGERQVLNSAWWGTGQGEK